MINFVTTVDGRYVCSENTKKDFPHLEGFDAKPIELTKQDFPVVESAFPPKLTPAELKTSLELHKFALEQKKIEKVQEVSDDFDARIADVEAQLDALPKLEAVEDVEVAP